MARNESIAIDSLLTPMQPRTRRPSARRFPLTWLLLLTVFLSSHRAYGTISYTGDITPADNRFTQGSGPPPFGSGGQGTAGDEGIWTDGNFIEPLDPIGGQTWFEGRHNDQNPNDPNDDTNTNFDILVGRIGFGWLLISESELRYNHLIIGDKGIPLDSEGNALPERRGTGVVRIDGQTSLFNNDPTILPSGLPMGFGSQTPRPQDEGFDLFVGRAGTGTLEMSLGGRAEIQDAVIVGDQPGSTGTLIVDGIDTFLDSGGFDAGPEPPEGDRHEMVIGRRGLGFMYVQNGGQVDSEAPANAQDPRFRIAAVIGSDPFDGNEPERGGQGTVSVTGPGSKWIVGGSLQIGGFHDADDAVLTGPDLEGDDVLYNSEAGRGTLNIVEGGFVNVLPAVDSEPDMPGDLFVAIGRFGRLALAGGSINVGRTGDQRSRSEDIQLINDGVIEGSGRIDTGVFRNRYRGELRVGPAETLIIDSSSEFTVADLTDSQLDDEPLSNYGVIQVRGGSSETPAELEFERAPAVLPDDPIRPFFNLRVARPAGAPVTDFYGGLISAQHSIMRFRSGLFNQGMLAITDGNNYITGDVINAGPPVGMPNDEGRIYISGPNTRAIFENDLILLPGSSFIVVGGASFEVLQRHSFITAGDLSIEISPEHSNQIFVAGDAGIAGKLSVNLSGFSSANLGVGDTFQIMSVGGQLGGVDLSDPLRPTVDLTQRPLFTELDIDLSLIGLPASLVMLPIYTSSSVLLSVFSIGASMGPDVTGDGVVDAADIAIWQANVGITMGATVLQGDADGDGDVDGDDFILMQSSLGPFPGAGAGSGSSVPGSVPEPTGLMLVLSGLLAIGLNRRRSSY